MSSSNQSPSTIGMTLSSSGSERRARNLREVVLHRRALVGEDQPRLVKAVAAEHAADGVRDEIADESADREPIDARIESSWTPNRTSALQLSVTRRSSHRRSTRRQVRKPARTWLDCSALQDCELRSRALCSARIARPTVGYVGLSDHARPATNGDDCRSPRTSRRYPSRHATMSTASGRCRLIAPSRVDNRQIGSLRPVPHARFRRRRESLASITHAAMSCRTLSERT